MAIAMDKFAEKSVRQGKKIPVIHSLFPRIRWAYQPKMLVSTFGTCLVLTSGSEGCAVINKSHSRKDVAESVKAGTHEIVPTIPRRIAEKLRVLSPFSAG